ncbi:alpha/beta hydrolase [Ornithinimicrobium sp. W1679]|uniref:alpha/beta hydrolase n=1 Tax=Ornithinimicrobium sp. W1679 TaxID=3418770 RepID=UPI003CFB090D
MSPAMPEGPATLAPEWRSPWWRLFDRPHDPRPPRRRPRLDRLLARLVPAGTGRPTTLPGADGGPEVTAYLYEAPDHPRPSGALLWMHGGGMVVGAPWIDHRLCDRLARELGLLVVSVDYRLAPEHPFPAAVEDCWAALEWLHGGADELGVDPARIGVAGASAGGGLAASVAQMACDRGLPLAFQGLVYPMLDDRTVLREDHGGRGTMVWTPAHDRDAWGWYLGHPVRAEEDRAYAVPARRDDLAGLAPAWVGVGTADLFHDEDVTYAERLRDAGVPVELVVVPGMPHAADMVPGIVAAHSFRASFLTAVDRAVGGRARERQSE